MKGVRRGRQFNGEVFQPGHKENGAKKLQSRVVVSSGNALHNDLGPYEPRRNGFIVQHVYGNNHRPRRHVQQQTALLSAADLTTPSTSTNWLSSTPVTNSSPVTRLGGGKGPWPTTWILGFSIWEAKSPGPLTGDLHDLA